jgi:AcrR family transcriptional regulator
VTESDTRSVILEGVTRILATRGLSGVTMRAVAQEADVALGLMNYHFDDKASLIAAALERVGEQDADLVRPAPPGIDPTTHLRAALRRVVDAPFLEPGYLGLRLQLWSLAPVDGRYSQINRAAQLRYRDGLRALIAAARPDLDKTELDNRAADVLVIQNGMWLTSILIPDTPTIERGIAQCERVIFAE